MLKRTLTAALLALCAPLVIAAGTDAPPPYAGAAEVTRAQVAPPARQLTPKAPNEDMQIAPTAEDMEQARENRERGIKPRLAQKGTTIEAVRDPNNRVTEYVVTPGSTQIPYTIENQADRPIDSRPGGNSKSTLGTTKFFEIGW